MSVWLTMLLSSMWDFSSQRLASSPLISIRPMPQHYLGSWNDQGVNHARRQLILITSTHVGVLPPSRPGHRLDHAFLSSGVKGHQGLFHEPMMMYSTISVHK
jgi:hypothetical protein